MRDPGSFELIYAVVARIPAGRVATYGQVAALAGLPRQARQVGYALNRLDDGSGLPWHRVLNARGEISLPGEAASRQRRLLEAEQVVFDAAGRVALARFRWTP